MKIVFCNITDKKKKICHSLVPSVYDEQMWDKPICTNAILFLSILSILLQGGSYVNAQIMIQFSVRKVSEIQLRVASCD